MRAASKKRFQSCVGGTRRRQAAAPPTFSPLEPRRLMTLAGNTLFPLDNPWNHPVTNTPVAANSATLVANIGSTKSLHPAFGTVFDGQLNGIPYNVVPGNLPKVNVIIDAYPSESDKVPVPIP